MRFACFLRDRTSDRLSQALRVRSSETGRSGSFPLADVAWAPVPQTDEVAGGGGVGKGGNGGSGSTSGGGGIGNGGNGGNGGKGGGAVSLVVAGRRAVSRLTRELVGLEHAVFPPGTLPLPAAFATPGTAAEVQATAQRLLLDASVGGKKHPDLRGRVTPLVRKVRESPEGTLKRALSGFSALVVTSGCVCGSL